MAIEARYLVVPLALVGGVTLAASGASAGCDVPFRVSVDASKTSSLVCRGPWGRESPCLNLANVSPGENVQFYCAEDTVFHPWGDWTCSLQSRHTLFCDGGTTLTKLRFNVQKSGPNPVNLLVAGLPTRIRLVSTSAEDGAAAEAVQAASFLGHADADPGAAAGGGDDVDSWNVQGSTGKPAVVRLEGDDTAGYTGGAATLQLKSGGAVLAQTSGALPLELSGQLGAGTHQIVVVEPDAGGGGPQEAGFRGHYLLTMTPQGGAEGLLLEPQPDVEPHE